MTILGQQTVAELIDLLKDKDYLVAQLSSAYASHGPIVSDVSFQADYNSFQQRWTTARSKAQTAIDLAKLNIFVANDMLAAQSEYDGILDALTRQRGFVQKGDFSDLVQRLSAAGAAPDFSQAPQPDQTIDVDLSGYKAADTGVKAVEATETAAGKAVKFGLGAIPWYVWAGGAVVLAAIVKKELID